MRGLSPVQVAAVRWVMIETIHAAGSTGASETMVRDAMFAAYPHTELERVRDELDYLASAGLVELRQPGVLPWTAKLTKLGRDVAEYIAEAPDGILRPQYKGGAWGI